MKNVVIVDGLRTPFIKAWTDFAQIPAQDLGAIVIRELLERNDVSPDLLSEVIIGNIAQPPEAANVARIIALQAGIPEKVPAFSVQRNCASGMEAIANAWYRIQAGEGDIYLSGGTESMSNIPLLFNAAATKWFGQLSKARSLGQRLGVFMKFKFGFLNPIIGLQLGLTDGFCGLNMGETAEILAKEFNISREMQDTFAMESHLKAEKATKSGIFREEIVPVPVPPKFDRMVEDDNGIREGQNMKDLAKLRTVFDRQNGSVTAGNASQLTDGAAAVLVMSEEKAKSMGLEPLGRIRSFAFAGLDPSRMGLGPAFATPLALEKAGIQMKDIQRAEINEAFAAQVIANLRIFESDSLTKQYLNRDKAAGAIDPNILNVNGGAIALGHPVGSSATRLIITLLKEMKRNNLNLGLATLCVGGGQGAAFVLERD
ncbi:MAG: thiolase family protein [Calditrichales bacterium]|nr:MAG: thiolase family protein [Calditrichales bacterium]